MVKKDTKVAVLGAGAMGCLFGGLMAEKGLDVTLIDVWKEHVDAINSKGLKMDGHGGDRYIKIKATTDPSSLKPVDAIIIMCKATALEKAFSRAVALHIIMIASTGLRLDGSVVAFIFM